jgi:aminopeptidase 2
LYTPTRLAAIAREAAEPDSIFSLSDRIGLVHDAFALGKAGYLQLSAALNLIHELRAESECASRSTYTHSEANAQVCQKVLVWDSINANLAGIIYTWWEREKVAEQLKVFRRVRWRLSGWSDSIPIASRRLCARPSLRNSAWNTRRMTART